MYRLAGSLAKTESIDDKNLSYKIYFYNKDNVKSHVTDFLKNFGTLYDSLKDLVTSKIGITDANADQMRHISYLMMWFYDKGFFIERTEIYKKV